MHHHPPNQVRTINLSIVPVYGPGDVTLYKSILHKQTTYINDQKGIFAIIEGFLAIIIGYFSLIVRQIINELYVIILL